MNYDDMGDHPPLAVETDVCLGDHPPLAVETDVCQRCADYGYDVRAGGTVYEVLDYCDCPAGRRLMLRSGRGSLGYDVNAWGDR